jgi:hypothetical protein
MPQRQLAHHRHAVWVLVSHRFGDTLAPVHVGSFITVALIKQSPS